MPIVKGKAMWASVTQPNTTYEPKWSVNLVVDNDTAQKFSNDGYTVKNKPVSEGKWTPLNVKVGNGSDVSVQYKQWESEKNGEKFKGLELMKVQVTSLIAYESDEDFDAADEDSNPFGDDEL